MNNRGIQRLSANVERTLKDAYTYLRFWNIEKNEVLLVTVSIIQDNRWSEPDL